MRLGTKIYTGYFARARDYANHNMALVSIALKDPWFVPKDLTLYNIKDLAPTPGILALKDKPKEYVERYKSEILGKPLILDFIRLRIGQIQEESNKSELVLMCYEAPDKFCHRHIVAEWLTEYGIPTAEYGLEEELKDQREEVEKQWQRQMSLFPLPGKDT